jgi:hypothetical protein
LLNPANGMRLLCLQLRLAWRWNVVKEMTPNDQDSSS